ncbi:MAG: hypothetical protein HY581_11490 [Nitrospirae bacterium]|nr:hypothetical protein [Nitrospirota bacterium]
MDTPKNIVTALLPLASGVMLFTASVDTPEILAAPPIYWCPNKSADQQYSLTPGVDCTPFVDREEEKQKAERRKRENKPSPVIKLESIQTEASGFLQKYRRFLDCCATDPDYLDELQELQDQASDLLKAIQETNMLHMGSPYSGRTQRQFTISEIIRSMAQARDDLRKLNARLKQVGDAVDRLENLDFEAASRERRRIEQEQESIARDLRPRRPPDSPRTGQEVEDTTVPNRIGTRSTDTTLPNAFGEDIGTVASPNTDQQQSLRPRVGMDSVDTTIPSRPGPASQDTTLPNSFGFDVGVKENPTGSSTTPSRVGPSIGDSSLNKR